MCPSCFWPRRAESPGPRFILTLSLLLCGLSHIPAPLALPVSDSREHLPENFLLVGVPLLFDGPLDDDAQHEHGAEQGEELDAQA